LLAGEPEDVQAEVLRINKKARDRSLQIALIVPVLASLLGLLNAFRMRRLPDPVPATIEGVLG
jgi:ABC-type spermidine/putrescine transport system permease subunit II